MKSDNQKYMVYTCAGVGALIGTIYFVTSTFGEWYADFDVKPVGLITGILTLIVYLLPFVISVVIGGGIRGIIGGLIGFGISSIVIELYRWFCATIDGIKKRIDIRKKTRQLKMDCSDVEKAIKRRESILKMELGNEKEIVLEANLIDLLAIIDEKNEDVHFLQKEIIEKRKLIDECKRIENRVNELAIRLKQIGNIEKSNSYLNKIK